MPAAPADACTTKGYRARLKSAAHGVNAMPFRKLSMVLIVTSLFSAGVTAQSFSPTAVTMFRVLQKQPNDLARYIYLLNLVPQLSNSDTVMAMQMLASTEDELGLYNEALRDFPLKSKADTETTLPTPAEWQSASAEDVIEKLAADRRIVMVNEAHHDAHTRQLTLELLPRMRALGFDYFAAEALADTDPDLTARGYPVRTSGSIYMHEPTYGEIVREAIKLGFKIVPYDVSTSSVQQRESGQAERLYSQVFAKDPSARLFVHAGYAHIDKERGRLGDVRPMAMELKKLTGIEPLSIDQTQFREQIPSSAGAYETLIENFPVKGPTVLINRTTGSPWSAHPRLYDVNVLLPPTDPSAVSSGHIQRDSIELSQVSRQPMLEHQVNAQRPQWLSLDGTRRPYPISTKLCKVITTCVVDAHYINELNDGIAADRYTFMQGDTISQLYLRPGAYRLRAWDPRGKTLYEQNIRVGPR